ncbi:P-loop containing nucleoside triphosphate hydrolase protein [Cladochytrium replicatum]|nr:P-loop containing nucleoside triphosphate hydrolase protein [Cladochytrium replicatum]
MNSNGRQSKVLSHPTPTRRVTRAATTATRSPLLPGLTAAPAAQPLQRHSSAPNPTRTVHLTMLDGENKDHEDSEDMDEEGVPSRRTSLPRSAKSVLSFYTPSPSARRSRLSMTRTQSSPSLSKRSVGAHISMNNAIVQRNKQTRSDIKTETWPKKLTFYGHFADIFGPLVDIPHNFYYKHREEFKAMGFDLGIRCVAGSELDGGLKVATKRPPRILPFTNLERQPLTVGVGLEEKMKDYQITGISFLIWLWDNGIGGILGDEMGLGKTLQTLSFLAYLKDERKVNGPFLIVAPLSVLSSWIGEAKKWTPTLRVVKFHGDAAFRATLKRHILSEDEDEADLYVTSYEMLVSEEAYFKRRFAFSVVCIDEGHRIKNNSALVSQALKAITGRFRLILTGTPLQNDLRELWSLFHWLYPEMFDERTSLKFDQAFKLNKGKVDSAFMDATRHLLERIMLRRTKSVVELSIPPKEEYVIYVPISPCQAFWYERLMMRLDKHTLDEIFSSSHSTAAPTPSKSNVESSPSLNRLACSEHDIDEGDTMEEGGMNEDPEMHEGEVMALDLVKRMKEMEQDTFSEGRPEQWKKLMMTWIQLRKCCDHPYLFPNSEPEPLETSEHVVYSSSKLCFLDKFLPKLKAEGRRVLIFSTFTSMLNILEDYLLWKGYKYGRLDGSTNPARRALLIRLFNQPESDIFVFMISTRAGGMGINMTAADTIILFDSDLNPQVDIQAMARAHRIGQKKIVRIYRLIVKDTIEESQHRRSQYKLFLDSKVVGAHHTKFDLEDGGVGTPTSSKSSEEEEAAALSRSELMKMLRFGAKAILRMGNSFEEFLKADIESILEAASKAAKTLEGAAAQENSVDDDNDGSGKSGSETAVESMEEGESGNRRQSNITRTTGTVVLDSKHNIILEQTELNLDDFGAAEEDVDAQTRLMQKKVSSKPERYSEIARAWAELTRQNRSRTQRVVDVDGHPVLRETIAGPNGGRWEAVPTYVSSLTAEKLASTKKRKRTDYTNQEHCQACHQGGTLVMCDLCPRAMCTTHCGYTAADLKKVIRYICPQHNCSNCTSTTKSSGGMLYRCVTCELAFCEICVEKLESQAARDRALAVAQAQLRSEHGSTTNGTDEHANIPEDAKSSANLPRGVTTSESDDPTGHIVEEPEYSWSAQSITRGRKGPRGRHSKPGTEDVAIVHVVELPPEKRAVEMEAIGFTIPEYERLGFGEQVQAFYVKCIDCLNERRKWSREMQEDSDEDDEENEGEDDGADDDREKSNETKRPRRTSAVKAKGLIKQGLTRKKPQEPRQQKKVTRTPKRRRR